ncbi:pyridoxal phosphate-dependent aminotransferase family protein [Echinicola sp. CAU 1574]|uniref:Pyridoxal phosphate-dependent aminotransferase family protein n=1 Tax=Echinicola arenosa TaxID=2774144 RepID=A0ABR9AMG0_9BACT|nr:aminotransferase class I/II-fold pyridoxal phosphate-dependent enzyme [Echinicola arenosa]MBD8488809.1 pyridoxal phosphate-dependent aminotransferase family protein [Echinicola arenosa]
MSHHPIAHKIDRAIPWEGRDYLYFSGTAYLGMGNVQKFEDLITAGIRQYGPNHGASRFSNVQLEVYDQLEGHFAKKAGAPYAALLSSGFMTGYICHTLLGDMADEMWAAPDAHPAILPPNLIYNQDKTFLEFTTDCIKKSQNMQGKTVAILSNAVDTMKPAVHNFEWVRSLSPENTYYLLIDDSHAFGILGREIYGTYSQWNGLPVNLVVAGSLGKALAIPAGIILGDTKFIGKVRSSPLFMGASPPAPGYCQAFLDAENLYYQRQQLLKENMALFYRRIKDLPGLSYEEHFPVVTFKERGWATKLLEEGIIISSFSYPRAEDPPIDRIVISAYHQQSDLERLATVM